MRTLSILALRTNLLLRTLAVVALAHHMGGRHARAVATATRLGCLGRLPFLAGVNARLWALTGV